MTREVEFDAGHRVPWHKSKCRHPHGHRYRVEAEVSGPLHDTPGESDAGMVVDFGDLKHVLVEVVHDPFDHAFIVYENDDEMVAALRGMQGVVLVPFIPTAENLAAWFYDQVAHDLPLPLQLDRITVWETRVCRATVTR